MWLKTKDVSDLLSFWGHKLALNVISEEEFSKDSIIRIPSGQTFRVTIYEYEYIHFHT